MKWPYNPIADALKQVYDRTSVHWVKVCAMRGDPRRFSVTAHLQEGIDIHCRLEVPGIDIDALNLWCETCAWVSGSADMTRWVTSDMSVGIDVPTHIWRWKPTFKRHRSPYFRLWLQGDHSLNDTGGRSGPCPLFRPQHLLEAARAYPPAGTGQHLITVFTLNRSRRIG